MSATSMLSRLVDEPVQKRNKCKIRNDKLVALDDEEVVNIVYYAPTKSHKVLIKYSVLKIR
jgi:hypothetical protein